MRAACQPQAYPAASLNRRFALSPVDALIGIKVGCGLRRKIPVRPDFDTLVCLRITVPPTAVVRVQKQACAGFGFETISSEISIPAISLKQSYEQ